MSKVFEFIRKYDIYIIAILVVLLYLPVFFYGFLGYDDIPYIINNKYLNGSIPISFIDFFRPYFIMKLIYTPLSLIISWLIIKLFGNSSFAFHFVNVGFYLFSCITLLFLLKKIIKKYAVAFFAVILYILHPCHVENTAWISGMGYNISVLFFFLSFYYFIIAFDDNKKLNYVYSVIFYILAILSQPVAITLPLILFLWVYFFRKERLKESIMPILCYIPFLFIYLFLYYQSVLQTYRFVSVSYSFLEKFQILGKYLVNSFLPFLPMPFYPFPSIYFLIPVIVFFIIFIFLKKDNSLYFWIFWYIILILQYSSLLFNIEVAVTDRYLILSSVASCVALSYLSIFIVNKLKINNLIKFLCPIIFFVFYLIVSVLYIPIWKDDKSLWIYAYNLNPELYYTMGGYCTHVLISNGNYNEALILANKMIKKYPMLDFGYNTKIKSLMKLGNYKEALDICELYNSIDSSDYRFYLHYMFDIYLLFMNDYDNAEKSIIRAEELYKKYNIYNFDETRIFREKKIILAYCKVEPNKITNELKNISDNDINKLIDDVLNLKYEEKENLCLQYLKNSDSNYDYDIIMLLSSLYMENKYGKSAFDEMKKITIDMATATLMVKSNKLDEAEKIYLSVIDRNKYILNAYLSLGYIYLRLNKSESALNILNRALEINPYDGKAKDMLKYIK